MVPDENRTQNYYTKKSTKMSCIRATFDGIYSGMYATYGYLMFQRKKCFILNWETRELRINHKKKKNTQMSQGLMLPEAIKYIKYIK